MAQTIIDNGGAGYSEVGAGWTTDTGTGHGGSFRYNAAGDGSAKARWDFTTVAATVYRVSLTWPPLGNRAENTPWAIYDSDNVTVLASGTLNQENAPNDRTVSGSAFEDLAVVSPSGTSLRVEITDNANEFVIADAALAEDITRPSPVVSTQGGDWSDASTWGGLTPPGAGDRALTRAADTVVMDDNVTVGDSPADTTTPVLEILGPFSLAAGKTLNVRGNARQGACTVTGGAGSALRFDFTAAASAEYSWQMGTANGQTSKIVMNGTSGSRCVIGRTTTNGKGYFFSFNPAVQGCHWDLAFTDLEYLNRASNNRGLEYDNAVAGPLRLVDCTLDNCGAVRAVGTIGATSDFELTRVKFTNTQGTDGPVKVTANAPTGTDRVIDACSFDTAQDLSIAGLVATDNYFAGSYGNASSSAWASFERNFVRQVSTGTEVCTADVTDCYWFVDDATGNPHLLTPLASCTIDGVIAETFYIWDNGDFVLKDGGGLTVTVQNCLLLPDSLGDNVALVTGGTPNTFHVYHNTFLAGSASGIQEGDYGSAAGLYANYKGNLAWQQQAVPHAGSSSGPYHAVAVGNTANPALATADVLTPANVKNNAGLNLKTGFEGKGFHVNLSASPDATNLMETGSEADFFVDPTRNIKTWAVSRGAAGTDRQKADYALAELAADPTLISSLIAHVRAGFVVTHTPWRTAAHDGTVVGAVQDAPPTGGAGARRRRVLLCAGGAA